METYHLIGLGGIGMSALARILLQRGDFVQGSDLVLSPLLQALRAEGAEVAIGHDATLVQKNLNAVVYTSDVKEGNVELRRAKELGLPLLHRSDLLHRLMAGKQVLLVTGTHGKTTTTSLLATVLVHAGRDPSFVIGGILKSAGTNGRFGRGEEFVAEADESDGSFLKSPADVAIVTNLEREHLNYWQTEESLTEAFRQFCKQSRSLFWCADDQKLATLQPHGTSYGFSDRADAHILDYQQRPGGILFTLQIKDRLYQKIELPLLGRHNALNGAAVFACALSLGVAEEEIRAAFFSFQGVGRRMDRVGEISHIAIYDDYGHHPTEIATTLAGLRAEIGERRLIVLFQPHRYSRLQDLSFHGCFEEADRLVVTDIYGAGEIPIPGLTGEKLAKELFGQYIPRDQLGSRVVKFLRPHDVVITVGAGDITRVGGEIFAQLQKQPPKLTIAVVFGGASSEHEISLLSMRSLIDSLDPSIYTLKFFGINKEGGWSFGSDRPDMNAKGIAPALFQELLSCDVAFPMLHGPNGEDGMVQGFFATCQIPYTGCDFRASALTMQKAWTKHVAQMNGVPTVPGIEIQSFQWKSDRLYWEKQVADSLSYPVWVKPVHLGSSIGVQRVLRPEDLAAALDLALSLDDWALVEKEVQGRQIEFAVLGGDWVRVAPAIEILIDGGFYGYEEKYGAHATSVQTPADLTPLEAQLGSDLAKTIYRAVGCRGMARVDFFLDKGGHYWLNEINPIPGFTKNSGYPKAWAVAGLSLPQLCNELIITALRSQI